MGTRTDVNQECEDARAGIEATRRRIEGKSQALRGRLSAKELAKPWIDPIRERLGGGGEKILEAFREHPLPLGLVGIGLGWLILRDARPPAPPAVGRDRGSSGKLEELKESVGEAAGAIQEKAHRVKESIGRSAGKVSDAGRKVKEAGRTAATSVHDWYRNTLEENPWLLALGAASVGAALGLGLPLSQWEKENAGELGERLVGDALEKGKEAIERTDPAPAPAAPPASDGGSEPGVPTA